MDGVIGKRNICITVGGSNEASFNTAPRGANETSDVWEWNEGDLKLLPKTISDALNIELAIDTTSQL